jgi:hypothetical protein
LVIDIDIDTDTNTNTVMMGGGFGGAWLVHAAWCIAGDRWCGGGDGGSWSGGVGDD